MAVEKEESIDAAEVAEARRERLRALRAAQELLNTPDQDDQDRGTTPRRQDEAQPRENDGEDVEEDPDKQEESHVNMKFRNYLPQDKHLQEGKVAPPVLPKFEDPVATAPPPEEKKEDPFLNIAPKKPNWDLWRDVQKKLDKLEKRTQKAMFKLMEEEEKRRRLSEDSSNGEDTANGED